MATAVERARDVPAKPRRQVVEHLGLRQWPTSIGGRPALAELGVQLEDALRAISDAPNLVEQHDFLVDTADEVRNLLYPKISVACLGRVDYWIQYLFWGLPRGVSDARCAMIAVVPPSPENWGNVHLRHYLLSGHAERSRLRAHVSESARQAIHDIYAPRSKELPPIEEEPEGRGSVELGWDTGGPNEEE